MVMCLIYYNMGLICLLIVDCKRTHWNQKMDDELFKAVPMALVCTIISFFNGGVRYNDPSFNDSVTFPPIWVQLIEIFLIHLAGFAIGLLILRHIREQIAIFKHRKK